MSTVEEYRGMVEKKAWESYEKARYLYHLTPVEPDMGKALDRLRQFEDNGILASNLDDEPKAIWFFTDRKWASEVASSIGGRNFALFRIRKKAIPRDSIRWDNVAEFCAAVSFYCLREKIEPEDITFVDFYRVR